jgi:hypothetical protein
LSRFPNSVAEIVEEETRAEKKRFDALIRAASAKAKARNVKVDAMSPPAIR